MNSKHLHTPLDLSKSFLDNINNKKFQNDMEEKVHIYENSHINPPFRYYKDDTNLNLTPKFAPPYMYKTKSLFPAEKPIQTEHDEIGINEAYLNKHFGYTNYGNYRVANQSLPEANKHKTTPKNNLFELL